MTVGVGILNKQGFRRGTEFNDSIPHDSIGEKRPGQTRALSGISTSTSTLTSTSTSTLTSSPPFSSSAAETIALPHKNEYF